MKGPHPVRMIIPNPETEDADTDEIEETAWVRIAMINPVFDFLSDPAEDINTIEDESPIEDQGHGTHR